MPQSPRSATGAHGVPPPKASSTRAVPWHPRTPTRPPAGPGNLAGLGPQPPRHRHDRPRERSPARAATPTPPTHTLLDQRPARGLSLLTRGREHFARGRPPPPPHTKPLAAGEGTTPNSGEAGFGPERADRGHDTPSAIWSRRAQRGGGGPVATGRGRTAGEGSGARGGSGSGEGCAPTEARTGPPGKRARDPTATSMRAVPRRPGRQPASAPLAGPPPPRTRPHHGWDPNPT